MSGQLHASRSSSPSAIKLKDFSFSSNPKHQIPPHKNLLKSIKVSFSTLHQLVSRQRKMEKKGHEENRKLEEIRLPWWNRFWFFLLWNRNEKLRGCESTTDTGGRDFLLVCFRFSRSFMDLDFLACLYHVPPSRKELKYECSLVSTSGEGFIDIFDLWHSVIWSTHTLSRRWSFVCWLPHSLFTSTCHGRQQEKSWKKGEKWVLGEIKALWGEASIERQFVARIIRLTMDRGGGKLIDGNWWEKFYVASLDSRAHRDESSRTFSVSASCFLFSNPICIPFSAIFPSIGVKKSTKGSSSYSSQHAANNKRLEWG